MSTLTIRLTEERKRVIEEEAKRRHETQTEFIMKSVMYRLTGGKQEDFPDPFLSAIAANPPIELTGMQRNLAQEFRQREDAGLAKTISTNAAADQLRALAGEE
jgi:hypothetical protein